MLEIVGLFFLLTAQIYILAMSYYDISKKKCKTMPSKHIFYAK